MSYLNFGCFDAELTDSEIRDFLRQGYYSFEDYAIAHWLDHVDSCTSQQLPVDADTLQRLAQTIESFFMKHGLSTPPDTPVSTDRRFHSIKQRDSTKRLDSLARLARQRKSNEDLLDLETQLQRRRLIYEGLVTNTDPKNDMVHTLSLSHGFGWFKCPRTWCEFFFDGFQHKERRDAHANQHERPFRCSFEDCLYAELGFETEKHAKRHEKTSHSNGDGSERAFPTQKPKKKSDIFSACKRGDLDTIKRLVREGADINQSSRPNGSITALSLAVKNNHSEVVNYLIGQGPKQLPDLFSSALNGASTDIVQMLLEMEAEPERKKIRARLDMFFASRKGDLATVERLVREGADINQSLSLLGSRAVRTSINALSLAVENNHSQVVKYLIRQGSKQVFNQLQSAIELRASTDIVQMVLEMEADPERKKILAQEKLSDAAAIGREDIVPLLLTYGIDINSKTKRYKETALQTARRFKSYSCVQVLLDHGALDETPEPDQTFTPTSATPPVTRRQSASFAPSKGDGQGPASMMPVMPSTVPDRFDPQPQDTAISGFNNLHGDVDVKTSFISIHV